MYYLSYMKEKIWRLLYVDHREHFIPWWLPPYRGETWVNYKKASVRWHLAEDRVSLIRQSLAERNKPLRRKYTITACGKILKEETLETSPKPPLKIGRIKLMYSDKFTEGVGICEYCYKTWRRENKISKKEYARKRKLKAAVKTAKRRKNIDKED